jgi:hypothetical protein
LDIRGRQHTRHEQVGRNRRVVRLHDRRMEANFSFGDDVDAPFALERGKPVRAQDRQQHRIRDVVRLDAGEVDLRADAAVHEELLVGRALHAVEQRRELDGR